MDLQVSSFLKPSPVRRALISVSDKTGLNELATCLQKHGVEIIGTSSTSRELQAMGFAVKSIDELTHFPEILGGRVKTLHPAVFGGILARTDLDTDMADLQKHGLAPIDLVVCNLYPFQNTLERPHALKDLVENIDIGGVTLLRAASKNFTRVTLLCDPADYALFMDAFEKNNGHVPGELRMELAYKGLSETAAYDEVISSTLKAKCAAERTVTLAEGPVRRRVSRGIETLPETITLPLQKIQDLRYGENPHQTAAFYSLQLGHAQNNCSLTDMRCFHGKELSYNNVLDIEHGVRLVNEFAGKHAAVIIKHNMPCGVGFCGKSVVKAYERAFESDPVSPFGGIVCLSSTVDRALAEKLYETFLEVIVAPDFEESALEMLQRKKNLRLVRLDTNRPLANAMQFSHVQGGFLLQKADSSVFDETALQFPTELRPDTDTLANLRFAFSVVKHVRSNAIVLANARQTIGIAGGFTNRVDAVEQCLRKARLSLEGAVLASDAFFPFPDSIELLKGTGVKAIIQPGGSVQDPEVVKAANRLGLAMVFTGQRHFKH